MALDLSAVLFDLDGVLVDACELHRQALNKALAEYDYTITDEEHYDRYNGLPTTVKLKKLTEEKGLPLELHGIISKRKQELTLECIEQTVKPNQDIVDLLQCLYSNGIQIAVCSNSVRASVEALLDAAGLLRYIHTIVGNNEGITPKPAPDLYLEGARRLGVSIRKCVIVEDSPVGLQAAIAANPLRVVAVKDPSFVSLRLLDKILGE